MIEYVARIQPKVTDLNRSRHQRPPPARRLRRRSTHLADEMTNLPARTHLEVEEVGPDLFGGQLALVDDRGARQRDDVEAHVGSRHRVGGTLPQHKHLEKEPGSRLHNGGLR